MSRDRLSDSTAHAGTRYATQRSHGTTANETANPSQPVTQPQPKGKTGPIKNPDATATKRWARPTANPVARKGDGFHASGAQPSKAVALGATGSAPVPSTPTQTAPSPAATSSPLATVATTKNVRAEDPSTGPVPTVDALLEGIGRHTKLDATQEKHLRSLSDDRKRMYGAVIGELDALKAGSINPAQYHANVLERAAQIAGQDGRKFTNLVGSCFTPDTGGVLNAMRAVLGNAFDPAGSALLDSYAATPGRSSNRGFNPMVLDNEDPGQDVTHHYGAHLDVAANRLDVLSSLLAGARDSKETNPGDVRTGRFAAMLGGGAAFGRISPRDAVKLHRWAFNDGQAKPPPWGNDPAKAADGTHFTAMSDYRLSTWVAAYNAAHPNEAIALNESMGLDLPA